jgi:hypothetical protein
VKILFIARHFTYFRNYESVIAALAGRGHRIHLAADREEAFGGGRELVDRLAATHHGAVTVGFTPLVEWGRYRRLANALRLGLDYLRYSDARYDATPQLRQRAHARTPAFILALARLPWRAAVTSALERLEAAVPRQGAVDTFLREQAPDLLLITPLIELGSPQLDYVRAARAQGVRSALCVWSWDHLSSKALIRVPPDALLVWNETQKSEAQRFHGIPAERVIVTGAQCFDQWFDRPPTRDREAFCRRVGLGTARPFVLWVCSALFRGSPSEAAFVREWVHAIRTSADPRLRDLGILIRPHPQRLEEWTDRQWIAATPGVAIWGDNPVDADSRADYYDSMFHSAAVVGLNTSALVEAAIVDRPVLTILPPEFHANQEGTFHFHYLLTVGEGFLWTSRSLPDHVAQLAATVAADRPGRNTAFVEAFIRPRGRTVPATAVFVEAAERLAADGGRDRQPAPRAAWLLRPVVYALVLAGRVPWLERIYWNAGKRQEWTQTAAAIRRKAGERRVKRRDKLVRVAHKVGERAVVRAKTAAKHALASSGLTKDPG